MKSKALLYAALAFLFVSCDENESEVKEAVVLAREESSPQRKAEYSASAAEAQAKKQKIAESVASCRARIKENPKAVFEWDNSIELDKAENKELVEAVIEAHAREMVRFAVTPGFHCDLAELKETWPYSDDFRQTYSAWSKALFSLPSDYLEFYNDVFGYSLAERGVDEAGERTLESLKKDKIRYNDFWKVCSVAGTEKSCFDDKGNAYEAYRCGKVLGSPKTLENMLEGKRSSQVAESCFAKMQEKFAPVFDKLMQDIANTTYPAWYVADDADRYIEMNTVVVHGMTLKDIKDVLNEENGMAGLRARMAAGVSAHFGWADERSVNRWSEEVVNIVWDAQVAYQEVRMAREFGDRINEVVRAFRCDMPQYLLSEGNGMFAEMLRQKWNNDFDFLLRTHEEYTPEKEVGYPFCLAPVDGANGVGVIAKSRVFQDVCFGMNVQELFSCDGAKLLAEKYDVDNIKELTDSFCLSAVTTLFGHPANVGFHFKPTLAQKENGETEIVNTLCRLEYSIVTSEEVKKELEEAQKRAQNAYDEAESQAKVAQAANDFGWSKTAREASVNTLNNLGEILAAQQKAEEIRQSQINVINMWVEGFCSAKKPYRKVAHMYTNNPYVKELESGMYMSEAVCEHDEKQERTDSDLNILVTNKDGDKYSVNLYPARYMSLGYRVDVAKRILAVMFLKQYMDYQKNKSFQGDANEF